MTTFDYCIVGGGIVGLATAYSILKKCPGIKLLLLEKEKGPGLHQTSHNSGVIHAGIYYAPGSLKADLCRKGLTQTKQFCRDYDIPFDECGKLIVATNPVEEERLNNLYERATANGLILERVSGQVMKKLEPNITGIASLLSKETAIVDFTVVCRCLCQLIKEAGAQVQFESRVSKITESGSAVEVVTATEKFITKKLVVCAGLQSDRLARVAGLDIDFNIVPFRGEYFKLPENKSDIVRHLIYPAPDPSLPFLGIHLTKMIDGSITVGPNAVLGFAREGYPKLSFSLKDTLSYSLYPGFWKLVYHYRQHTLHELKGSLSKRAYLSDCQKYCPSLTLPDLQPYRAGIRAQVVMQDGAAVHDFLFKQTDRMLHVCNAPSPAATSALPIGEMIAQQVIQ